MGRHVQEVIRHEQVNVGTGRQRARWADTFKRSLDTSRQKQGRMEAIRTAFIMYDSCRNIIPYDKTFEISLVPQGVRCPHGTD